MQCQQYTPVTPRRQRNIKLIKFFKKMPIFSLWKWKHWEAELEEANCWVTVNLQSLTVLCCSCSCYWQDFCLIAWISVLF
jgi:hypothetical protein